MAHLVHISHTVFHLLLRRLMIRSEVNLVHPLGEWACETKAEHLALPIRDINFPAIGEFIWQGWMVLRFIRHGVAGMLRLRGSFYG